VDLLRGTGSQRDHRVGVWDQSVELCVVQAAIGVMGVPQVVHGVDQGPAEVAQGPHESPEVLRAPGVEAELDVEEVEVVAAHPLRTQHHRRPPDLLRGAVRCDRIRICEAAYAVGALGRDVSDVHVRCRH
jgi:hypothetical protein